MGKNLQLELRFSSKNLTFEEIFMPRKLYVSFVFHCIALSLFAGYADFEVDFASQPEKLREWQEMAARLDHVTDGLGLPIDEKIKETVIVLNLLGFETFASCEGHLDHGWCYPWIDIDPRRSDSNQDLVAIIKELKIPNDQNLNPLIHLEEIKEQYILQQVLSIHQLLEQFYATSKGSFYPVEIREEIFNDGRLVRIYSSDGKWQLIRQDDAKKAKLLKYRAEMDRFTNFLINKFLNKQS